MDPPICTFIRPDGTRCPEICMHYSYPQMVSIFNARRTHIADLQNGCMCTFHELCYIVANEHLCQPEPHHERSYIGVCCLCGQGSLIDGIPLCKDCCRYCKKQGEK